MSGADNTLLVRRKYSAVTQSFAILEPGAPARAPSTAFYWFITVQSIRPDVVIRAMMFSLVAPELEKHVHQPIFAGRYRLSRHRRNRVKYPVTRFCRYSVLPKIWSATCV